MVSKVFCHLSSRLVDIRLTLDPEAPGLGISIAGGSGSPSGQDLPIVVKRILPATVAEKDGRLKPGDELVAVNDTLLVGVDKNYAVGALSNLEGEVRLLVLQDYWAVLLSHYVILWCHCIVYWLYHHN